MGINQIRARASTMIPAMDAYGLSIDTVSDHMDGIAYVVNHSLISFSDLSSVFASLGTTLSGMGFTMEDTEALLLAMTDAGIPAARLARSHTGSRRISPSPAGSCRHGGPHR